LPIRGWIRGIPSIRFAAGAAWLASWYWFAIVAPTRFDVAKTAPWPIFAGMRAAFAAQNHGISLDASALVSGMAIGDAHALSPALKAEMQQLSLTHLVAVSGSNCAIVGGLALLLCARVGLSRWMRTLVAVAVLVSYVGLVGPQPSVLRAAAMATAVLVARAAGRATSPIDALSLAILVLVIADPSQGANLGFGLSVAATLGILVLAPQLAERLSPRMPKWLALGLAVSASAQLLCMPLLLGLQGGIPVWSVFANLLAEPIVAPTTILGLLAVLVAPLIPPLAHFLCRLASVFSSVTVAVADFCSRLPMQLIPWPTGWVGQAAVLVTIVACIHLLRNKARMTAAAALALSLLLPIGIGLRHNAVAARWPASDWTIANCDVGQGDGLVLRSKGQVMVLDVGREEAPIAACLKQLGVGLIDILELTHFDLDHIGGLNGVLNGHPIAHALLTSFSDSRPGADFARRALDAANVPITYAGIGIRGELGDLNWRVISPTLGASEAEDANDGSIGMFIEGEHLCLLTLADLGKPGQERLLASKDSWFDPACRAKPIVLKVGHHGSANQSADFTRWLQPDIALISVGRGNKYGHPTPSCLEMLASTGAQIWRTDQDGGLALATGLSGLDITTARRG